MVKLLGRGGSSSGSTSDYGLRGPGFNSHWELGFFSRLFLFSFSSVNQWCVLNQVPRGGATLLLLPKANGFIAWVIFLHPRLPLPVNYFELNYLSFQRGLFELSTEK